MQAIKTSKDSNSGCHSLLQGETKPFKPYKHRFFTPYRASGSTSTLWYSIKRASAYIIVMSSYSAYGKILYKFPPSLFQDDSIQNPASSSNQTIVVHSNTDMNLILVGKYTPQYKWLTNELPKVNRSETPWLIVLMHVPMYSTYVHHFMEGETMRVIYESWFVKYKVDVVFAGHVHAYERSVSAWSLLSLEYSWQESSF